MALWGNLLGLGRSPHYDQGIRFFDQGLHEQAISCFERALGARGGDGLSERLARFYLGEAHAALAQTCLQNNRPDRAEAALLAALDINPGYADLHYYLGIARLATEDLDAAITSLSRALEINPRYAKAHLYLAVALYQSGDGAGALRRAAEALALDDAFPKNLLAAARAAHEQADHDAALCHLKAIADADVDDIAFHAKLAHDLFRRGLYDEAAGELRAALALNPGYADLRNQLGVALYAAGQDEPAETEFKNALAINPRYVEAHVNRGMALLRLNRPAEAQAAFTSAIVLDPDNVPARDALRAAALTETVKAA